MFEFKDPYTRAPMDLTVAFEYDCGYSYKAMRWLRALAGTGQVDTVTWRPFSLHQVNNLHGGDWFVWEHPEEETRSFLALAAAAWLEREQPATFPAFHAKAFETIQDEHRPLDRETVLGLAAHAGADRARLAAALESGEAQRLAGESHTALRNEYGVFGTPTLIFRNGAAMYVRLRGQWRDDEHRLRVFRMIDGVAEEPIIGEIQRPLVGPPQRP
jgi:2-hydroxychromene-2-carboxylate isomerase